LLKLIGIKEFFKMILLLDVALQIVTSQPGNWLHVALDTFYVHYLIYCMMVALHFYISV